MANRDTKAPLSEADRNTWYIRPGFHKLSYEKKKHLLAEIIDWADRMNLRIDAEYEKIRKDKLRYLRKKKK